jgi:hypothetical protein
MYLGGATADDFRREPSTGPQDAMGLVGIIVMLDRSGDNKGRSAAKKLIIRIVQDGRVWWASRRHVEEWFDVTEEESGVCQGETESNTVAVEKQQASSIDRSPRRKPMSYPSGRQPPRAPAMSWTSGQSKAPDGSEVRRCSST